MLEPAEWEFWDTWMRAQRLLARELDRGLQRDCGISKAEFSVLMTLTRPMRVGELAGALGWEKSRVAHLLTRMENRGLVARIEDGATGRRTGVELTAEGRRAAESAVRAHGANIRRLVFDRLTPDQAAAIRAWSEQLIESG
ncbi:MarR family winged helix-turn-helix transcriptional regulator [Amycolatopsis vancoresmycina]|uniref:MarR family transcriptional regulator n=1 Tax=Amycolatopsis vancoresmycina DSM 44592 TaxID=1292037 RepID=R1G9R8_9PSEU|nr:MarR family winged helix-turn-helix transcriptional regulator [Amycolatopsis vancoresmycina]EOD68108.1 MarR family transcriptional regulator [Amycolatopsis vancoresmycina DSM 44592]